MLQRLSRRLVGSSCRTSECQVTVAGCEGFFLGATRPAAHDRSGLRGDCLMTLVAGVDSSTQACKVVVCDAGTGTVVREGRAGHPAGTEVDPHAWEEAL